VLLININMYRFVQRNKESEPAGKERFLSHSLFFQQKRHIIVKQYSKPTYTSL
jgi:hypothetical protein